MNEINKITNLSGLTKRWKNEKSLNFLLRSSISNDLSQGENFVERGPLATVGVPTSQHSEKNLRNDGESECGWPY